MRVYRKFYNKKKMLIKDLIKDLEKLLEDHKSLEDGMGETCITIDVFEEDPLGSHNYKYCGIQDKFPIQIHYTGDGVYPVLSAFAIDYPSREQVWEEERKKREERDSTD